MYQGRRLPKFGGGYQLHRSSLELTDLVEVPGCCVASFSTDAVEVIHETHLLDPRNLSEDVDSGSSKLAADKVSICS